jgi:hypothetical protein
MMVSITRTELGAADLRAAATRSKGAAAARRMLGCTMCAVGRHTSLRPSRMWLPRRHTKDYPELVAVVIPEDARDEPIELWWPP